jgi:hypothetical protein
MRSGGVVQTVLDTALAPLADSLGADTVALGPGCPWAPPSGRSRHGWPGWCGRWGESVTWFIPLLVSRTGGTRSNRSSLQWLARLDPNNVPRPDNQNRIAKWAWHGFVLYKLRTVLYRISKIGCCVPDPVGSKTRHGAMNAVTYTQSKTVLFQLIHFQDLVALHII